MIVGLSFRGTYKVQFLERELSEGTRSNGLESCGDDVSNENCDSSYPDVSIGSPPPALNCNDVPYKNIKVEGNDQHGFDRDSDGIGCES
jgi:hypothetical protein